jgi:5'-deoxynucleotidase
LIRSAASAIQRAQNSFGSELPLGQKAFHFFAYMSRMKLIDRWSLMRCTQRENVQEHSLQVAMIAHALTLIKNKYFYGKISAEKVAVCAMFHDATEVLTGDMPTPVKYYSKQIRSAYHEIESHAAGQLMKLLPDDLKSEYLDLLVIPEVDSEIQDIIKAADTIAAYLKCLEEQAAGNNEFSRAQKTIEGKVTALCSRPEVEYFVKHFVPSFSLTIDEISQQFEMEKES